MRNKQNLTTRHIDLAFSRIKIKLFQFRELLIRKQPEKGLRNWIYQVILGDIIEIASLSFWKEKIS